MTNQKKKWLLLLLIVPLAACLWLYKNQPLNTPQYPLSQEDINACLAQTGIPWHIEEEDSWQQDHMAYTLQDSDGTMTMTISTAKGAQDGRFLQLGFISRPTALSKPVPAEDWEQVVSLAQLLYGGFRSERELNKELERAGKEDFTVTPIEKSISSDPDLESIRWATAIRDMKCTVIFARYPETGTVNLSTIVITNSDEFLEKKN